MTAGFVMNPGGSQGDLCLDGSIGRHSLNVQVADTAGHARFVVDVAGLPTPTGLVAAVAGETWNFQAWYRDANPGPVSNFTDAVAVTFR